MSYFFTFSFKPTETSEELLESIQKQKDPVCFRLKDLEKRDMAHGVLAVVIFVWTLLIPCYKAYTASNKIEEKMMYIFLAQIVMLRLHPILNAIDLVL